MSDEQIRDSLGIIFGAVSDALISSGVTISDLHKMVDTVSLARQLSREDPRMAEMASLIKGFTEDMGLT